MWHTITTFLYLTCVHAQQYPGPTLYPPFVIEDRMGPASQVMPSNPIAHKTFRPPYYDPNYPQYYPPNRNYNVVLPKTPAPPQYSGVPIYITAGPDYNYHYPNLSPGRYIRSKNLGQTQNYPIANFPNDEDYPNDSDYDSSGELDDPDGLDLAYYTEQIIILEKFAHYLRQRTKINPKESTSVNNETRQYNALLAVLIALARVIRASCLDFHQVYDQVYYQTIETYYEYGLVNAEKISDVIEQFIQQGNANMPKIMQIYRELCEKEKYCAVDVDSRIRNSALLFKKELEALEALSHLAQNYFAYMMEFNEAARKGTVHAYLLRSKDRLKEYIMFLINSLEHISDQQVMCSYS